LGIQRSVSTRPKLVHLPCTNDIFSYNHATILKNKQDAYCDQVFAGQWKGLGDFPEDLQWEALVDVLRGKVKVNTHCYETVDLDDLVRVGLPAFFQY
jgi:hypothetical protein